MAYIVPRSHHRDAKNPLRQTSADQVLALGQREIITIAVIFVGDGLAFGAAIMSEIVLNADHAIDVLVEEAERLPGTSVEMNDLLSKKMKENQARFTMAVCIRPFVHSS